MNISGIENIKDIFNIFHDGEIIGHKTNGSDIVIEIEIQYLAVRIKEGYKTFKLSLLQVDKFVFDPWYDDSNEKQPLIENIECIFTPELELLSAELKDNILSVACNQPLPGYAYCGGSLKIQAKAATVQDEFGTYYSLKELQNLASSYWNEWSQKNA